MYKFSTGVHKMNCRDGAIISVAMLAFAVIRIRCDCKEGLFKCNTTNDCVAQWKNCDGKPDCPDASDEWSCADKLGDQFYDLMFRKRPGAENDINESCSWFYIGQCRCKNNNILCQHLGLTQVPRDLYLLTNEWSNVTIGLLDFTGNKFHEVNEFFFASFIAAQSLVMRHCNIRLIGSRAFHKLKRLEIVYLDQNEIRQLHKHMFPVKNRIKQLILSGNHIENLTENVFEELTQLIELDLRDNEIGAITNNALESLINLKILYLNGNRIEHLQQNVFPSIPLSILIMSGNRINIIESGAFSKLDHLQSLFLSENKLQNLSNGTFSNLTELLALNLNSNHLQSFQLGTFVPLQKLSSLHLDGNSFKKLDIRVLQNLKRLQYVYFSEFSLCRAAKHVRVCEPKGDGISSQKHLLDNPLLRASVWIMGTLAVIGNVSVLLGRFLAREPNAIHSLYIRNLAISDLLMGVYLILIATADQRYRNVYIDYEDSWRHSVQCSFCGFLNTLSFESSVMILALVTWDRLVSVTRPLTRLHQSRNIAMTHILTLWFLSIIVSIAPLIPIAKLYFGEAFYGSNGVCLSLHIHDPFAKGWEFSAVMFILVTTFALVFIIFAYGRMLREIRTSGVAVRSTQESQERTVAKRFALIIITDCLCWLPIISVKLAALLGMMISESLYAWLAILVLPINSALNPVLYTLTTTMFKQQIKKTMLACPCLRRIDGTNSGYESALSYSLGAFPVGDSRRQLLSMRISTAYSTFNDLPMVCLSTTKVEYPAANPFRQYWTSVNYVNEPARLPMKN